GGRRTSGCILPAAFPAPGQRGESIQRWPRRPTRSAVPRLESPRRPSFPDGRAPSMRRCKPRPLAWVLPLLALSPVVVLHADGPGPTSAVPKGEVTRYTFARSKVFPGTVRDYWVYVPRQYDPKKPACVYVNQDGVQYNAPAVFDELIHKKEMPVVIGVFVMHGRVKAPSAKALDRFNRSYEYDGLGDYYARFLLEELL